MWRILTALLIGLPLLELYLLILVGSWIGPLPVLALVVLTAVGGVALAKAQGLGIFKRMRADMLAGRVPAEGVIDGVFVLLGGLGLMVPGLITDLVGLFLILPVTRRWLKGWVRRRMERMAEQGRLHIYIR